MWHIEITHNNITSYMNIGKNISFKKACKKVSKQCDMRNIKEAEILFQLWE